MSSTQLLITSKEFSTVDSRGAHIWEGGGLRDVFHCFSCNSEIKYFSLKCLKELKFQN